MLHEQQAAIIIYYNAFAFIQAESDHFEGKWGGKRSVVCFSGGRKHHLLNLMPEVIINIINISFYTIYQKRNVYSDSVYILDQPINLEFIRIYIEFLDNIGYL